MLNQLKADLYRMQKEKSNYIPLLLAILIGFSFSYFMRNVKGEEGLVQTVSGLSTFIPLFFMSTVTFFWGEDFSLRTINHLIVKSRSRFFIVFYKTIMTIIFSTLNLLIIFLTILISRYFFLQELNLDMLSRLFIYQAPIYFCIILLCEFIFNYVDKIYQAYLIYIILVLMFDNLFGYVSETVLGDTGLNDFFILNHLKAITGHGELLTPSIIIALIFSVIYFCSTYFIFSIREFK